MSKVMGKTSSGLVPPTLLSGVIQESNPAEGNWEQVRRKRSSKRPVDSLVSKKDKENNQPCHGEMFYTKSYLAKTLKIVPGPDQFQFDLCHGEMLYTKSYLAKTLKIVPGPDQFQFDLRSKEGHRKRVRMPKWEKPKQRQEPRTRGQKRKADNKEKASKKKDLVLLSSLPKVDQDYINYEIFVSRKLLGLPYSNDPEEKVPLVSQGLRAYIIGERKKWYKEKYGKEIEDTWFEVNTPYVAPTPGSEYTCLTSEVRDIEREGGELVQPKERTFRKIRNATDLLEPEAEDMVCEQRAAEEKEARDREEAEQLPEASREKVVKLKMKTFRKIRNQQIIFKKNIHILKEVDKEENEYNLRMEMEAEEGLGDKATGLMEPDSPVGLPAGALLEPEVEDLHLYLSESEETRSGD